MLDAFTVSFFGHREVEEFIDIEKKTEQIIKELLFVKKYVIFLIGRNGEFDQLVSSAIRRAKKECANDNCYHILVLPYETAEYRDNYNSFNEYYDRIDIYESSYKSHYKTAFQNRNREMVNRSDLVVFYLDRESGGAYKTYQYAVKQKKDIIKLSSKNQSVGV